MQRIIATFAFCAVALLAGQPTAAQSQDNPAPTAQDSAQAKAHRRAEGTEAARNFHSGEGNPIPEPKPKASGNERAQAREARKSQGAAASRAYHSGDVEPRQDPAPPIYGSQRRAERSAKRKEVSAANKAGLIPNYGEGYGSNQK